MFRDILRRSFGVVVVCGCCAVEPALAQVPVQRHSDANKSAIAAVVDGHTISSDEVEKIAVRKYGQEVLNNLIDNYLIGREAERLHVEVSEAEINNQVQALAEAIKPKTLEEGLKEHHQTLLELRDDFRHRLLALKLAAMNAAPGHFVHAQVILIKSGSDVKARAEVDAIKKRLRAGAKFEDLAKQYSQDPISRARGGDIGVVFSGCGYDPKVIQAALQLNPGMVTSDPVRAAAGYYLIMVSSTDSRHTANEDKLYSNAKMHYEMDRGARNLPEYLRELRAKATITQFLEP